MHYVLDFGQSWVRRRREKSCIVSGWNQRHPHGGVQFEHDVGTGIGQVLVAVDGVHV